jgi:hypothetical protein
MKKIIIVFAGIIISLATNAQGIKNLAERLGYPRDSKLLIIHADDMGLSHSVNTACIKAFENKGVTSGSIMVPCPWAPEIETWAKENPGMDVGIHLTLNAEWDQFKWGGVTSSDQIKSLLDSNGYFYASVEELGKKVNATEAEKELKAQIDRVIAAGIHLTHLDTHMGSVMSNPALTQIYLDLSNEYHLPVLLPRSYLSWLPANIAKSLENKLFLTDNVFILGQSQITGKWIDPYKKAILEMKPGLNEIIVHLAIDNDEMKAICKGHESYGSAWRQHDLDMVLSTEFKDLLKANQIVLIGWHDVLKVMNE